MISEAKRPRRRLFEQGIVGVLDCAASKLSVIVDNIDNLVLDANRCW